MSPRHLILANPSTPRGRHAVSQLAAWYQAQGEAAEIESLLWSDVVPRDGAVSEAACQRPALLRIESPGKDAAVARLLLAAGARSWQDAGREPPAGLLEPTDWAALPVDKGRLYYPGLAYVGLARVLAGLAATCDANPQIVPNICPRAAAEMFDKNRAAARLIVAGVPMPERLTPPPTTVADLWTALRKTGWPAAFVKLAYGSSATGIAVVHLKPEPRGVTTVVERKGGFYNTRSVQTLTGAALERVLAFILAEGASVERAVRLAQIDGQNFDLRVIVIAGRAEFVIFRLSPHPMTNIHLGGRRGDLERCRREIPPRSWLDALDAATLAAEQYDATTVGVDVALERGALAPFVLEVNAFGDFFPGYRDERGRTIPQVEIPASIARARERGWAG